MCGLLTFLADDEDDYIYIPFEQIFCIFLVLSVVDDDDPDDEDDICTPRPATLLYYFILLEFLSYLRV